MRRQATEPHLEDGGIYRMRWWACVDGRQPSLLVAAGALRLESPLHHHSVKDHLVHVGLRQGRLRQ